MSKASMRTKLAALETRISADQWKSVMSIPATQGQDLTFNHVEVVPGVYRSRHHDDGRLIYTDFDLMRAYVATLEDTHACIYRVLSVAECESIRNNLMEKC
jgi:hypothetical protein